jgi:hypothetical protein
VWRRRPPELRRMIPVPAGYGWGLVGVGVFAVGGLGDMLWHVAFGIEAGIDALVSPTHLLLLSGGVLLITSPLRAATSNPTEHRWPAVISLASATSLAGFFLSYVSVFADPGARQPLGTIPHGLPGHEAAELPAIAGLGSYLVSTVLLVVPVLYLRRHRLLLPYGTVTILVAAVAIPAATLSRFVFLVPAAAALAGAIVADLILIMRPRMPDAALASLVPALIWTGQLLGLASIGYLRWPPELWAGVVVLTALLAWTLTWLITAGPTTVTTGHSNQPAEHPTRGLSPDKHPDQRAVRA